MALKATIEIDGKSYTLLECEYEFSQTVDQTGRPVDKPRGGMIHIIIAAPSDNNLVLHEWMRDKNTTKKGDINITVNEDNKDVPKTISFEDAHCVKLYEYFNSSNEIQMYLKLSIMAGTITFGKNCKFSIINKTT